MKIYFWLFKHARTNRLALWIWRRWAAILTLGKHLRRRNWRQSATWCAWLMRSLVHWRRA